MRGVVYRNANSGNIQWQPSNMSMLTYTCVQGHNAKPSHRKSTSNNWSNNKIGDKNWSSSLSALKIIYLFIFFQQAPTVLLDFTFHGVWVCCIPPNFSYHIWPSLFFMDLKQKDSQIMGAGYKHSYIHRNGEEIVIYGRKLISEVLIVTICLLDKSLT